MMKRDQRTRPKSYCVGERCKETFIDYTYRKREREREGIKSPFCKIIEDLTHGEQ